MSKEETVYVACKKCVQLEDGSFICTRESISETARRMAHEFTIIKTKSYIAGITTV